LLSSGLSLSGLLESDSLNNGSVPKTFPVPAKFLCFSVGEKRNQREEYPLKQQQITNPARNF
jgi:hypothetical protein